MARIIALIVKELQAILRDRRGRVVLFAAPLIQLMVFGYAATFDLNRVPVAIYDQDGSEASRQLVARFLGAPAFALADTLRSDRRIDALIDSRAVQMVLVIGRHFTRDLLRGRAAPVQVIVDGRNSNTALIIVGYANTILTRFGDDWRAARGGRGPPAHLVMRARYNPALRSQWFVVPGIVALLTQVVTLVVIGLSVAREREAGTFDQLLVTPLTPLDILIGKSVPGLLIGMVEASVIVLAAVFWFHVPLRGSIGALYAGLLLFVTAVTGVGLAISAVSATQQQALLGAFLFMVPSVILSGFATPIANMPLWVERITLVNPLRYMLVIVRATFLEGAGFATLAGQFWPMAAIGAVNLGLAAWLFRKRST
ncbi:unnamed protein product [Acidocella sp. C78]|uniref:ABC transporter permease n=1 Tax=Acidocella sp. C78 TaxID=1671486 RepID=UPI00191BC3E0|nr:ABC transporter permease [Acidocella sp. C78]CAG4914305.1 unnamed protein product [Acidocella sp. C78]